MAKKKNPNVCDYPCVSMKKIYPIVLGIVIFAIIIIVFVVSSTNQKVLAIQIEVEETQSELNQTLMNLEIQENFNSFYYKAKEEYLWATFDRNTADTNYNLFSFYYEEGYYSLSVDFCVNARDLIITSNSAYSKSKSYFEQAKKLASDEYVELIETYINLNEVAIDINWAKYEACEYYEVASINYYNGWQDAGDSELEEGNKKIEKHDALIVGFNDLISKTEVLEEVLT